MPQLKRLIAEGPIRKGSVEALEIAIQQNPGLKLLELESTGGLVSEMHRLVTLVEQHQMDTLVRGTCVSACTDIFLAGARRFITSEARFGFHRSGYCGLPENAPWETPEFMSSIFMRQKGVTEDFVGKTLGTPYENLWKPSAGEVLQSRFATHWWNARPPEYQ